MFIWPYLSFETKTRSDILRGQALFRGVKHLLTRGQRKEKKKRKEKKRRKE